MSDAEHDGVIARLPDGGTQISFEWRYDRPVEAVWAALTEPARLALWLADAEIDLRPGGTFRLHWRGEGAGTMEGVITEVESPGLLAHSWSEVGHGHSSVRWELAPDGRGTILRLTHTFAPEDDAIPFLAGWHDFLYALLAAVDGYRSAYDREREKQIDAYYRARLGEGLSAR